MDPDANLSRQGDLAQQIIDTCNDAGEAGFTLEELTELAEMAQELAELSTEYLEWIRKGGFAASRFE